jgi:hypothetical protein
MGGTEPASFEATILSRTTTTVFSPLKISENSLEFGSQEVGTTSESRTIILVSAGEGVVEIGTVAISDSQPGTSPPTLIGSHLRFSLLLPFGPYYVSHMVRSGAGGSVDATQTRRPIAIGKCTATRGLPILTSHA